MSRCNVFKILFSLLPFKSWQDRLLIRHVESCDSCRTELIEKDEARSLLSRELRTTISGDLWQNILTGLAEAHDEPDAAAASRRTWIVGTAAACALLLLVLWIGAPRLRRGGPAARGEDGGFMINSIRVGGKPASTFYYQPSDSDMILVWAEKEL